MEFSGRGVCSTLNFQNRPDRLRDLRGTDIAPLTKIGVAGSLMGNRVNNIEYDDKILKINAKINTL